MEPLKHEGLVGFSYAQAQQVIGAKHQNYVRQLASQGKIRIVGKMPTSEGSEVTRTLLNVEDVLEAARKFKSRANDDNHVIAVKLPLEAIPQLMALLKTLELPEEFDDLTIARRKHAKASAAKKKAAKAKANKAKATKPADSK